MHTHSPLGTVLSCAWRQVLPALVGLILLTHSSPASAECDATPSEPGGTYAGVLIGAARMVNWIVDVDGFANWGHPGSMLDYDDVEFVGTALVGRQLKIGPVPMRFEVDGTFGDMQTTTDRLDPIGLDETATTTLRWVATVGAGTEHTIGRVTVFGKGGLAVADIANAVTDIDYSQSSPPRLDPDDSFRDISTDVGWMLGAGLETALADGWALRLDGSYLAFGSSTYAVNRERNNRCGPGGPHRPCLYTMEHTLGLVRLGIIYRFGR